LDGGDAATTSNRLVDNVRAAMPDFEGILWVDADNGFVTSQFYRLWDSGYDFVGAKYMQRNAQRYAHRSADAKGGEDGFAEVTLLGGGFTLMRRKVFETIGYHPFASVPVDDQGQMSTFGEHLFNMESFVCNVWRKSGGRIYVDTLSTVSHKSVTSPIEINYEKEHRDNRQGAVKPVACPV
jgi:hypothetical protein